MNAEAGPLEPRPIFIVGSPRSGTSILTWALGQHPNIQTMEESDWIASIAVSGGIAYSLGSVRGEFGHLSSSGYPREAFFQRLGLFVDGVVQDAFRARCRAAYGPAGHAPARGVEVPFASALHLRRRESDAKSRWIDGAPVNTAFAMTLSEMFPEARFIHALRRPEDVALSLENFERVGGGNLELEKGFELWISHTEAAWQLERALGAGRVFRLRFERLAEHPETLLRELCEFLDEPFHPDCLEPLGQRLNSSKVELTRDERLAHTRHVPAFAAATSLYWRLQRQFPGQAPDPEAAQLLHVRFEEFCQGRSLI